MNKKIVLSGVTFIVLAGLSTIALARREYMAPTGATACNQCHLTAFGTGYKPGMIAASLSPLGKFEGLKAWLNPPPPVAGADTKPVIHPVDKEWDVTVGEVALTIPVRILDEDDDNFALTIDPTTLPGQVIFPGMSVSALTTDGNSNLPQANFVWKAKAAQATQAGQTYNVSLFAKETGTSRTLSSAPVTVKVHVWAARTSATKNVSQLIVQRAQWNNNQLFLAGKILFKSTVTPEQRTSTLSTQSLSIKSEAGVVIGSPLVLAPDAVGDWKSVLTLSPNQVPCSVILNYEGLNASRTVKLAPTGCVK